MSEERHTGCTTEAWKPTLWGCPPASKEDSVPSHLQADRHPWLGSAGWEVILQWQWPLGP